jgi:hypothetical protein
MKKLIILTAVVFGLIASSINAKTIYKRNIDVNYFYSSLEPYGEWIEVGYDDFVWRPYKADYDWRPYAEGRWEWTRHGWYWVSYEPFGWATYHYGRWYYDDYYGWVWMPDNEWAPAWVEWRYNDFYIGWAPLPPYARFNWRRGIHFSIKWHSGYHYWNFVKYNHFVSHNIHHHFVHKTHAKYVFNKTKYRTNYYAENNRIVNGGVSRKYVERKVGRKLSTRKISRTDNIKDYNSLNIKTRKGIIDYRPSEKTVRKSTFDKSNVKKGRALKSLRNDKIAINRRTVEKKNSIIKRNDNKSTRKIEKKSSDRSGVRKKANNKSYKKIREKNDITKFEKKNPVRKTVKKSAKKNESSVKTNRNEKSKIGKKSSTNKTIKKSPSRSSSSKKSFSKKSERKSKSTSKKEVKRNRIRS